MPNEEGKKPSAGSAPITIRQLGPILKEVLAAIGELDRRVAILERGDPHALARLALDPGGARRRQSFRRLDAMLAIITGEEALGSE